MPGRGEHSADPGPGKAHPGIDVLAARLEGTLGGAGYPSRSQVIYADRASALAPAHPGSGSAGHRAAHRRHRYARPRQHGHDGIAERTREIGVLRCLGARAGLRHIFPAEPLCLAS